MLRRPCPGGRNTPISDTAKVKGYEAALNRITYICRKADEDESSWMRALICVQGEAKQTLDEFKGGDHGQ